MVRDAVVSERVSPLLSLFCGNLQRIWRFLTPLPAPCIAQSRRYPWILLQIRYGVEQGTVRAITGKLGLGSRERTEGVVRSAAKWSDSSTDREPQSGPPDKTTYHLPVVTARQFRRIRHSRQLLSLDRQLFRPSGPKTAGPLSARICHSTMRP